MAQPELIKDIEARVKKSGDTMTGKLYTTSNSHGSLGSANTQGAFRIDGGTSYEDGAFLSLHGANSTFYPNGAFQLVASDGTTRKELFGDTTGILKWDDNIILHSGNFNQYALPLTGGIINGDINASKFIGIFEATSGFGKIYSFTKQLQPTTSWIKTGISSQNLPDGCYIICMKGLYDTNMSWQNNNIYVGIMSWYSSGTNSSERFEILLHSTGHARNSYNIYLSTFSHNGNPVESTTLEIKSNKNYSRISDVQFNFIKLF